MNNSTLTQTCFYRQSVLSDANITEYNMIHMTLVKKTLKTGERVALCMAAMCCTPSVIQGLATTV